MSYQKLMTPNILKISFFLAQISSQMDMNYYTFVQIYLNFQYVKYFNYANLVFKHFQKYSIVRRLYKSF